MAMRRKNDDQAGEKPKMWSDSPLPGMGLYTLPWLACDFAGLCTRMPRCCSQTSYCETTPAQEWPAADK